MHQPIETELKNKVKRYHNLTEKALNEIEPMRNLGPDEKKIAADFMEMAGNYFSDAVHFEQQKQLLTALAAYSYAHAWLDAGVRAGLFDAKGNDKLFTLKK